MIVLVDIGNARIKWASLAGRELADFDHAMLNADPEPAVARLAKALRRPERVLVANVAGADVGRLLTDALARQHGVVAEFARTSAAAFGVTCGYRDPTRLGVDRWLAVIAAHELWAETVCLVDAGTALTVDAVNASGAHYGGLILPGLRTMADSLQLRTSDIGATRGAAEPPAGLTLFGRSTEEAVSRAALLAAAALVDRCAARIAAVEGHAPRIVVTGGDGEALQRWLESPSHLDPHLVLKGLARVARGG